MALISRKKHLNPSTKFDIRSLLSKYNLWRSFKSNMLSCEICDCIISFNNLGTTFEDIGLSKIFLVCKNPTCIKTYLDLRIESISK